MSTKFKQAKIILYFKINYTFYIKLNSENISNFTSNLLINIKNNLKSYKNIVLRFDYKLSVSICSVSQKI